jgi:hypothetical protein
MDVFICYHRPKYLHLAVFLKKLGIIFILFVLHSTDEKKTYTSNFLRLCQSILSYWLVIDFLLPSVFLCYVQGGAKVALQF